ERGLRRRILKVSFYDSAVGVLEPAVGVDQCGAGLIHLCNLLLKLLGQPNVVAVDERDKLPGGLLDHLLERGPSTSVRLDDEAAIEMPSNLGRPIGAAVDEDQNVEVTVGLREYRLQRLGDRGSAVVDR